MLQIFRAILASVTLIAEINDFPILMVTTRYIFLGLEPMFPMVAPYIMRITKRKYQILVLGMMLSVSGFSAAAISLIYFLTNTTVGMIIQILSLIVASILAFAIKDEDIDENYYDTAFDTILQRNLGQNFSSNFLWACVFPAGGNLHIF